MDFVADKIKALPPYLFAQFQKRKEKLQLQGMDVIDLGIGAPDLPTPKDIIKKLTYEVEKTENHRYSPFGGIKEFKEAVAYFYKTEYDVELNPDREILTLIGSKEGLVHLFQAVTNPGDTVLVPNPGYPAYRTGVHLAGAKVADLPLDPKNQFKPRFDQVADDVLINSALMLLNYPNNPTAATVDLSVFNEAINIAKKHRILLAHDAAYDLVEFSDYKSPSVMQVEGAKQYAVEFGSLSKSFNMTGWRIGYVVGNEQVIGALATLKSNVDSSQFIPIQKAASHALRGDRLAVTQNNVVIEKRMEKLYGAFKEMGLRVDKPKGTIFLWVRTPEQYSSITFAEKLLEEAGIIVTPGSLFGSLGEGFFRVALTVSEERLDEVIQRLKNIQII